MITTREKLEAIIENEIENMPWKYRDLRNMFLYSMKYNEMTKEEIDDQFEENGLPVSPNAKEWATFNNL